MRAVEHVCCRRQHAGAVRAAIAAGRWRSVAGDAATRAVPIRRIRGARRDPLARSAAVRGRCRRPVDRLGAAAAAERQGQGDVVPAKRQLRLRDRGQGGIARLLRFQPQPQGRAAGAIYVSCAGRGGPHFGAPSAELQVVQHALGEVPLVGFFANGEIAYRHLYGYTGVLTVFTN